MANPKPVPDYEPRPRYAASGGDLDIGWQTAVATLPTVPVVLALDGPSTLDWQRVVDDLTAVWSAGSQTVNRISMLDAVIGWDDVLRLTETADLADDPDFLALASCELADLLLVPAPPVDRSSRWLVYGPGAALVAHDVLWYADRPKRFGKRAIATHLSRNLGQPADRGPGSTRRLLYVDWPLLDRHRDAIARDIDRWFDLQDAEPASLSGGTLRRTLADLARRPFRTQPTFDTAPWGGHWAQDVLGHNAGAPNTALGYELIAPESGIVIGDRVSPNVEIPFSLLVALHPEDVLGPEAHAAFGTSFPIRFDYLDTVRGGNLSVHCHPQPDYMRTVFGWPYTQHETYYIVVGGEDNKVFLGLRGDADLDAFARDAHAAEDEGHEFDIEQYVQTFPASVGTLFMVPAGTPHGSGAGNVVLEVSATPYLYSLRFYDWLRRDGAGSRRPVHVEHAFHNLNTERAGERVRQDLVQDPEVIKDEGGCYEERLGRLRECFFEVRRIVFETDECILADTEGRFHVLNVVDGTGIELETGIGSRHVLHRSETLLVPASCGPYRLRRIDGTPTRVVKALVL